MPVKIESSVGKLMELSRHDAIVHAHFTAWYSGGFQSFEQMLVALCIDLAEAKQLAIKTVEELMSMMPGPVSARLPKMKDK